MEQVEEICDKIVLINRGKNVLYGDVKDIKQQFKDNLFQIDYHGTLPEGIQNAANVVEHTPQYLKVKMTTDRDSNAFLRTMLDAGVYVTAFNEILPSLNEIFIKQVAN